MVMKSIGVFGLWALSVAGLTAATADSRLVDAVQKQDKETVRNLLKQRVDVNAPDGDGATALTWAAHWDDLDTAEQLIRAGANVNVASDYGVTALWEACNKSNAQMVGKLAKAGANPNATLLATGETVLMRCARTGNADAVSTLIAGGANVNAKENQKGQTALMWALEEGHPQVAKVLVEHGADIHAKSKSGYTPLLFAARQGDVASGRLLLEAGADPNEPAPGGQSVLLFATDSGREEFAIFLLEKGANPNAKDRDGLTALHYSLRRGISLLRFVVHDLAFTPLGGLEYLLRPDMPGLIKALLEHGADPNARISKDLPKLRINDMPHLGLAGATPFLLASASCDLGVMRALLAKGAGPNIATEDRVTPLMVAAGVGRREDRARDEAAQCFEAVKMLVDLGADVNAISHSPPSAHAAFRVSQNDNLTAMHGAAYLGANDIIQYLADKGAKLDVKNMWGQTPLDVAEGDPNRMVEGYVASKVHESTANLIQKLTSGPLAKN